jgi:hypothetical protein
MVFVEVRLNSVNLLRDMADMRIWLDRYRIDGTGFSCLSHPDGMLARVTFKKQSQAEAFAARFAGRVVSDTGPPSGRSAPPPPMTEKPAASPRAIHRVRSEGAGKHAPLEPASLRMKGELGLQALKQALDREIAEPRAGSRRPRAG